MSKNRAPIRVVIEMSKDDFEYIADHMIDRVVEKLAAVQKDQMLEMQKAMAAMTPDLRRDVQ